MNSAYGLQGLNNPCTANPTQQGITPDPGSLEMLEEEEEQAHEPHDQNPDVNTEPDVEDPSTAYSRIEDVRIAQQFIEAMKNATLYNGDLSADAIATLLDPPEESLNLDPDEDEELLMCLRLFLGGNNSATLFNSVRETMLIRYPNDDPLTYDKLKRKIRNYANHT